MSKMAVYTIIYRNITAITGFMMLRNILKISTKRVEQNFNLYTEQCIEL